MPLPYAHPSPALADDFWFEDEDESASGGTKAYNPHEARDPATGQWVSTPGSGSNGHLTIPLTPSAQQQFSDGALIQAAVDEASGGTTSHDLDPHPGPTVPNRDEASTPEDVGEGDLLWEDYLSPSGYQGIQNVARGEDHDTLTEKQLREFETALLPKYGRSRKGKETWRVTTLDHMSAANKKKLAAGKPVTVKEPGLLSLGVDRASTEYVGEQTHPESRSRVELRVKVATGQKAMDSLQKIDGGDDPNLLPEYVYPRGMKLHFTGKSHIERRPFFDFSGGGYSDDPESWKVRNVKVYDVELRGP